METATPRKLLRHRAVSEITGFSQSTIARKVKAGQFPKPVKLGPQTLAWVAEEVEVWLAARIAERDSQKAAA